MRVSLPGSVIGSCGVYDEVLRTFSNPRLTVSCQLLGTLFSCDGRHVVSFIDDHLHVFFFQSVQRSSYIRQLEDRRHSPGADSHNFTHFESRERVVRL